VRVQSREFTLVLREPFVISRSADTEATIVQAAVSHDGLVGYGEGAPDSHYRESIDGALEFLNGVEPLLGDDPLAIGAILERVGEIPGNMAAK